MEDCLSSICGKRKKTREPRQQATEPSQEGRELQPVGRLRRNKSGTGGTQGSSLLPTSRRPQQQQTQTVGQESNPTEQQTQTIGQESNPTEVAGADFNGSNVQHPQHEAAESDKESSQLGGAESDEENPQIEAAENKAYEMRKAFEDRLKGNLKNEQYDKLKANFNTLKDKVFSAQIAKFEEEVKGIVGSEQAKKITDRLSHSYDETIKEFASIIDVIKAEPQELGTEQQEITAIEKRHQVELAMGQGVAANLGQVILHSKEFSTCSPIVLFNKTSKIGGLFHFPAKALDQSKRSLREIYTKINPTEIHVNERTISELVKSKDADNLKEFFNKCGYTGHFHSIKLQSSEYAITLKDDGKNVLITNEIDSKGKGLSVMHDKTEKDRQRIAKEWQGSPLATKYGIDDWHK